MEGEQGAEDEPLSALGAREGEGPPFGVGADEVRLKGDRGPEGLFAVGTFPQFGDVSRGVEAVEVGAEFVRVFERLVAVGAGVRAEDGVGPEVRVEFSFDRKSGATGLEK